MKANPTNFLLDCKTLLRKCLHAQWKFCNFIVQESSMKLQVLFLNLIFNFQNLKPGMVMRLKTLLLF